jgi:phosphoribosylanthranilate isomerase
LTQVLVKVCGVTRVDDALACADAGVDYIGLNFHPASPRSITVDRGAEISFTLGRTTRAQPVGLFVDRSWKELAEVATETGLGLIQLHGDEPPEYLLNLKKYKPPLPAIRAFRLSDIASVDRMIAYLDRTEQLGCPPHAILVDAHVPGRSGGTGQSIPPEILNRLPAHPRLILAGGLDPFNVAERVALVRPWMVDVASGVESSPGIKDLDKVLAFVNAAKGIPRNTA